MAFTIDEVDHLITYILSRPARNKFVSIVAKKNAGLGPAGGPKPKNFAAKNKKRGAHGLKKQFFFVIFIKNFVA